MTDIPMFSSRLGSWRIVVERRAYTDAELRSRYDVRSDRWQWSLEHWGFATAYARLARRIVAHDPRALSAGSRVLECGAGTGALSFALARASRAGLDQFARGDRYNESDSVL